MKVFRVDNLFKSKKQILFTCFYLVGLVLCTYLVIAPLLPEAEYRIRQTFHLSYSYPIWDVLNPGKNGSQGGDSNESNYLYPKGNTQNSSEVNKLVISKIGVDVEIVEGNDDNSLSRGAWRRPGTSTPDKGSNTVLTGHRFEYLPPNNKTFYNLDKLVEGDQVLVFWEKKEYVYKVKKSFVVAPDQTDIEAPTQETVLTLYTCTPLWTAQNRLVVQSELVEVRD